MQLTLTVTEGPDQGRVFSFDQHDLFLVGRSPDTHFSLANDPYFSRVHFMVEINPPLCRIVDMRSRNGTLVNHIRLEGPRDLEDGDEIEAGQTRLRVSMDRPVEQPAPTLTLGAAATPGGAEGQARSAPLALSRPPAESTPVGRPPASSSAGAKSFHPEVPGDPGGLSTVAPPPLTLGFPAIPGYELIDKVGEGGMGVVYKARRQRDGLLAAVKTIRPAVAPDETTVARFLREAEILKQLRHPHIVSFTEIGKAGALLFFAMEFVPGRNLADIRQTERGTFPAARAVRLVCQLLEALHFAHGRGFVHRDIKPGNVLVAEEGGEELVKLADFGLARTYQASQLSGLTMTGSAGGTPQYMPPEQVRDFRRVKPAADQYSAAATLFYLLTGQTLYPAATNTTDLLVQILNQSPLLVEKLRPDLPPALAAAIGKALSRQPEARFADVGQFRQALAPFRGQ